MTLALSKVSLVFTHSVHDQLHQLRRDAALPHSPRHLSEAIDLSGVSVPHPLSPWSGVGVERATGVRGSNTWKVGTWRIWVSGLQV